MYDICKTAVIHNRPILFPSPEVRLLFRTLQQWYRINITDFRVFTMRGSKPCLQLDIYSRTSTSGIKCVRLNQIKLPFDFQNSMRDGETESDHFSILLVVSPMFVK